MPARITLSGLPEYLPGLVDPSFKVDGSLKIKNRNTLHFLLTQYFLSTNPTSEDMRKFVEKMYDKVERAMMGVNNCSARDAVHGAMKEFTKDVELLHGDDIVLDGDVTEQAENFDRSYQTEMMKFFIAKKEQPAHHTPVMVSPSSRRRRDDSNNTLSSGLSSSTVKKSSETRSMAEVFNELKDTIIKDETESIRKKFALEAQRQETDDIRALNEALLEKENEITSLTKQLHEKSIRQNNTKEACKVLRHKLTALEAALLTAKNDSEAALQTALTDKKESEAALQRQITSLATQLEEKRIRQQEDGDICQVLRHDVTRLETALTDKKESEAALQHQITSLATQLEEIKIRLKETEAALLTAKNDSEAALQAALTAAENDSEVALQAALRADKKESEVALQVLCVRVYMCLCAFIWVCNDVPPTLQRIQGVKAQADRAGERTQIQQDCVRGDASGVEEDGGRFGGYP